VETARGEIQFWLQKPDKKTTEEISLKKIQGQVSPKEQSEIKKLVIKHKDLFLKS
jgi:hypothetical protein